jgi:hypothetical protein
VAELLGVGLTHYPPLLGVDEDMSWVLRWTLEDPDIPDSAKAVTAWPERMRAEWGDDDGVAAAAAHRAQLMAGFDRVHRAIDGFEPDVVVVFGDDQYENFREDLIPPFAVLAYEDMDVHPWSATKRRRGANHWGEPEDAVFPVPGAPEIGRRLVTELLAAGFDMPYAYQPLHHEGLPHSFLNALLLLDEDRRGLGWPIVPVSVNCYGRRVVSHRGTLSRFGDKGLAPDPPGPSPARCMDLGAAVAEIMLASPWRTVLMASSSWSHAFLTDHTWRLYPDHDRDLELYQALLDGDFATWRSQPTSELERSGQQELLNWFCLVGAMERCGATPEWSSYVPTHVFNSNKVFAVFPVAAP